MEGLLGPISRSFTNRRVWILIGFAGVHTLELLPR